MRNQIDVIYETDKEYDLSEHLQEVKQKTIRYARKRETQMIRNSCQT